jgi:hypothetical protein
MIAHGCGVRSTAEDLGRARISNVFNTRAPDRVAVALAVVAALALALLPTGSFEAVSCDSAGGCTRETGTTTLIESDGFVVLAILAVPVALTGLLLVTRQRLMRLALVVLLGFGCLISAASIGLFFLPALAAAIVSVGPHRG